MNRPTRLRQLLPILMTAAVAATAAAGEDSWVGTTVVTKPGATPVRDDRPDGDPSAPSLPLLHYRVVAEDGGRVAVRVGGRLAWLDKDDVVPAERAVDYFTRLLRADP